MKSLKAQHHLLADSHAQMDILANKGFPVFQEKMKNAGVFPLKPTQIELFQVNLGKMCNQTCKHCHVDAGPDRKEIMTKETLLQCLEVLAHNDIHTVDLTGGAPEMNPHFRWFVEECRKLGKKVMVRCNLTIIVANKKYHDLPHFFKENEVEVVSSLPFYNKARTDSQRGEGVFEDSIKALKMLNEVGYGKANSGLVLDLVYNPAGAFMPAAQNDLEKQFKQSLKKDFDIDFNRLFAITNMPISRFLDYLLVSGNYENYMEKLINAFNPAAVAGVMCRNTISVGWDGKLYDCDFNQMLDLGLSETSPQTIGEFDLQQLTQRAIVVNQHCYGCTAGAGSSCGGAVEA
jgi:radical SAM/Cys-rich protein